MSRPALVCTSLFHVESVHPNCVTKLARASLGVPQPGHTVLGRASASWGQGQGEESKNIGARVSWHREVQGPASLRGNFLFSNQHPPPGGKQAAHRSHASDLRACWEKLPLFSLFLVPSQPSGRPHCDHLHPQPHPLLAVALRGEPQVGDGEARGAPEGREHCSEDGEASEAAQELAPAPLTSGPELGPHGTRPVSAEHVHFLSYRWPLTR